MADQIHIRRWLIAIGKLNVAKTDRADAIDFVDTATPMLAARFSDEMFTVASLEFVTAECRYLPTYGEIVALLRDWRRQLPEPEPAGPAISDNVSLGPKDRFWFAYWQRREAEGFAPTRAQDGRLLRPDITDWREHVASLVRQNAPDAWAFISQHEMAT